MFSYLYAKDAITYTHCALNRLNEYTVPLYPDYALRPFKLYDVKEIYVEHLLKVSYYPI